VPADGFLIEVELSFAFVALMLEVRVTRAGKHFIAGHPENGDPVSEKQSVVQDIELGSFDLLDITVKGVFEHICAVEYTIADIGVFALLDKVFSGDPGIIFLHYGRKFYLYALVFDCVITVMELVPGSVEPEQRLYHQLRNCAESARAKSEYAVPEFFYCCVHENLLCRVYYYT
jgi:hypothetical protein